MLLATCAAPGGAAYFTGAGAFAVAHELPHDGTLLFRCRSVESEPLTHLSQRFETEQQGSDFGRVPLPWTL